VRDQHSAEGSGWLRCSITARRLPAGACHCAAHTSARVAMPWRLMLPDTDQSTSRHDLSGCLGSVKCEWVVFGCSWLLAPIRTFCPWPLGRGPSPPETLPSGWSAVGRVQRITPERLHSRCLAQRYDDGHGGYFRRALVGSSARPLPGSCPHPFGKLSSASSRKFSCTLANANGAWTGMR
jgi:hypothetical protein